LRQMRKACSQKKAEKRRKGQTSGTPPPTKMQQPKPAGAAGVYSANDAGDILLGSSRPGLKRVKKGNIHLRNVQSVRRLCGASKASGGAGKLAYRLKVFKKKGRGGNCARVFLGKSPPDHRAEGTNGSVSKTADTKSAPVFPQNQG